MAGKRRQRKDTSSSFSSSPSSSLRSSLFLFLILPLSIVFLYGVWITFSGDSSTLLTQSTDPRSISVSPILNKKQQVFDYNETPKELRIKWENACKSRQLDKCREFAEQILQIQPRMEIYSPSMLLNIGSSLCAPPTPERAIEPFVILTQQPDWTEDALKFAVSCFHDYQFKALQNHTIAKQLCNQLIKHWKSISTPYSYEFTIGIILNYNGFHSNSIEVFTQAITNSNSEPVYYTSYINRAIAKGFSGQLEECVKDLKFVINSLLNQLETRIPSYFNPQGVKGPYEFVDLYTTQEELSGIRSSVKKIIEIDSTQNQILGNNLNVQPPTHSPLAQSIIPVRLFTNSSVAIRTFEQVRFFELGLFTTSDNLMLLYDAAVAIHFKNTFLQTSFSSSMELNHIHVEELVFVSKWSNFYHWFGESLSRIILLVDSGFFIEHPKAKILVPSFTSSMMNFCQLLNIPQQYFYPYDNTAVDTVIHVDQLHIVISDPTTKMPYFVQSVKQQLSPPVGIQLLNRKLNPNPLPLSQRKKIIYLARQSQHPRSSLFDDQLIQQLSNRYGEDFYVHGLQGFSVDLAINQFRHARLIFGPHGAGHANALLATPGQTVIIQYPTTSEQHETYFAYIAACLNMVYWTVPSVSTTYYGTYENSTSNLNNVVEAIEIALDWIHTNWES